MDSTSARENGAAGRDGDRARILLVSSVGFASGWVPHGIALLKSYLARETGFDVETLSLCVKFSRYLAVNHPGLAEYDRQMGEWGSSFHELYFASRYFAHAEAEALLRETARDMQTGSDIFRAAAWEPREEVIEGMVEFQTARMMRFCALVEEFSCRELLEACRTSPPVLIGFSVTAQQIFSSAVLARLARTLAPDAAIVVGGPAVTPHTADKLLEIIREADHVVYGDGELPLRELALSRVAGAAAPLIPGVLSRNAARAGRLQPAPSPPLDDIPAPDYDEIREEVKAFDLPLTTWMGRGCSWGQCEFCAIPQFQRRTRNRSPRRIYEDLVRLHVAYGVRKFRFGDWEVNGDPRALATLCDLIAGGGHTFELWAEVNARHLSPNIVLALKTAGLVGFQVGLEAFSPSLLRKMNKPASVSDNIQAILYSHAYGVPLFSNLLFNFPGETQGEVAETLATVRLLRHLLRPPVAVELIEFLQEVDADAFGRHSDPNADRPTPYRFESRCLPDQKGDWRLFFLRKWEQPRDDGWIHVHSELLECRQRTCAFTHTTSSDGILLYDSRDDVAVVTTLTGREAELYQAITGRKRSVRQLEAEWRHKFSPNELGSILRDFARAGWAYNEGRHWLALSLPDGCGFHDVPVVPPAASADCD